MEIYFDNAATTKTSELAIKKMVEVMQENYANPSSLHGMGFKAEKEIRQAVKIFSDIIGAFPEEIYFVSGATEANNTAIFGTAKGYIRTGKHIITSRIEHPSVLRVFEELESQGWEVTYIEVDSNGYIDMEQLKNSIRKDTVLVSIMYVNNEIGTVQDIEAIGRLIKEINPQTLFHVDAVQGFGKYRVSVQKAQIDLMSISGHKFHAPKGVGMLYIRKNLKIKPLIYGGGQQKNMRSGTENTPAVAAMAEAAKEMYDTLEDNFRHVSKIKEFLIKNITENIENAYINGDEAGSPYILNVSFEGVRAEVLLHSLELENINISAGSACSSHKKQASHVLVSIGLKPDIIEGTVRFSFSRYNTLEEAKHCVEVLKKTIPLLRKFKRH